MKKQFLLIIYYSWFLPVGQRTPILSAKVGEIWAYFVHWWAVMFEKEGIIFKLFHQTGTIKLPKMS